MMKEIYENPVAYIEKFKMVDVITTSVDDIRDDDNNVEWGS